jgi:hypothetical protein
MLVLVRCELPEYNRHSYERMHSSVDQSSMFSQLENPPWWALILFFAALIPVLLLLRGRSKEQIYKFLESGLITRVTGVFLSVLALGVFFLLTYHPLLQMKAKAPSTTYVRGAVFLAVTTFLTGLVMFAAGSRCRSLVDPADGSLSRVRAILLFGMLGLGLAAEFAIYRYALAQGYK